MKSIYSLGILLVLLLPASGQSGKFVQVANNKLTDSSSKALFLDGVNLGGWLLWEEWIWGGGFNAETKMKERLSDLLGDGYNDFLDKYYNSFITEKDISLIASKGFNSIRLPFNYRLFEGEDPRGFRIVDSVLNWCRTHHVYVILDMHAAPGGQTPYFIADPSGKQLWQSDENKQKTIAIWKQIAARYANEPVVAGYDLLNEPKTDKAALVSFYTDLCREIRTVDKNHLLIVEGNKLAHDFDGFPAALDSNQVYSYHYYAWFAENNKKKELNNILKTIQSPRPLWLGEWGEDNPGNLQEIRQLMKTQPQVCGMAFWTWKRVYKNNQRFPLCSIQPNGNWDKVLNWISWKLFKPKPDEVKRGTEEFLRAIKVENCNFNEQVKDATMR